MGKVASSEPASLGLLARDDRRKSVVARGRWLKDTPVAWIFLAPVLILFGIAVVFPLFDTIRLSFFDIKGLAPPKYVGFGNYVKLFVDPAFRRTLSTTLIFTVGTTVIAVGVGWVVAMLCAFAPRQTLPFRVMIFSAFGVSEAVTGYMWITMLRPDSGGLVNSVIRPVRPSRFRAAVAWRSEYRALGADRRGVVGRGGPSTHALLRIGSGDSAEHP